MNAADDPNDDTLPGESGPATEPSPDPDPPGVQTEEDSVTTAAAQEAGPVDGAAEGRAPEAAAVDDESFGTAGPKDSSAPTAVETAEETGDARPPQTAEVAPRTSAAIGPDADPDPAAVEAAPDDPTSLPVATIPDELSDDQIALLLASAAGSSTESELSDDEIAALLGGGGPAVIERPLAVEQVLADSVVGHEGIPMLTHILDRLRSKLTVSLRNHTSDNVDISDLLETLRYGEYTGRVPLPVLIGVAEAREWQAPVMILFDAALIYGIIELLMGGRNNTVSRPDQRQFTAIEQKMIERTIQIVLDDLGSSFSSVGDISFQLKHLEVNPRFVGLTRDSEVCIIMRLKVNIERRSGFIDIVLPRGSLDPLREQMEHRFVAERGTQDARWEERLRGQLTTTPVDVISLLRTPPRPVHDVIGWKVGTVVPLGATPETPVDVLYGGMQAWTGVMGRKSGQIAVCLDRKIMNG